MRNDGRENNALRPVTFQRGFTRNAGGSVLIAAGQTRVLCTAMIEPGVPPWLIGKGQGWLTAEYGMLPGSTNTRKKRDTGKPDGRSVEIQRLLGRTLRSIIDLKQLGENTLWVDCDVLQADGGTRTASITGAYVAVRDAVASAGARGLLTGNPLTGQVAAVSVGMVRGECLLDLNYLEDVSADVDMNIGMLADGSFVEVQGTGERSTFTMAQLTAMMQLAADGVRQLHGLQNAALEIA